MNTEQLLTLIRNAGSKGCSIEEMQAALAITKKADFTSLLKLLNELTEQYQIALNHKQHYVLPKYVNLFTGILRLNKKGFGFVEIADEDMDDIYIGQNDLNFAMDKDKVVVDLTQTPNSTFGKVIAILDHGTKFLVGTARKKALHWVLECDNTKIMVPVMIEDAGAHKLVDGYKIKLNITQYLKNKLVGQVDQILGHEKEPGVDVLSILTEYDIFPEFNHAVLEQVSKIPDKVMSYQKKNRVDLRDVWVCTIDGEDAKDLDDAISIKRLDEGYLLGVHIADVSYYVTQYSPLDLEAYNRGTSVYVADRVVPMLPHPLSSGVCSLQPHVDRLTLTCEMEFDHTGHCTDYRLFPSLIRSKNRMTYTNVNRILDQDPEMTKKYQDHVEDFQLMHELSLKIRELRYERGAIDFDTSEAKLVVNEAGKVTDIYRRERFEAERIIEDFMISANECVAQHMRYLELPFLYRIHEEPEAKKIREFAKIALLLGYRYKGSANQSRVKDFQTILEQAKDSEEYPVLSMWMLRSMSKAKYDPHCLGHFGLASENYTHFTSPIRRYPDLIVHRMLRKYVFQDEHDLAKIQQDAQAMSDIALQSSSRERAAVDAERAVEAMKKAEFFEDKINMQYNGIISSVTNFGMFIELENTVEGLVHMQTMYDDYYHFDSGRQALVGEHSGKLYRLGQKVRVRVKQASKKNATIDFELVSDRKANGRRPFTKKVVSSAKPKRQSRKER